MKCHYCEREAVRTIGYAPRRRHVCPQCAEACECAQAYVETIFTPDVLDRIFDGTSPEPQPEKPHG